MTLFNDRYLKSLKPRDKSYVVVEKSGAKGGGKFAVKVYTTGAKSFYIQYFFEQKKRLLSIGVYAETPAIAGYTLVEGRKEFNRLSLAVHEGKDPKAEQESALALVAKQKEEAARQRLTGTFEQLVEAYTNKMMVDGKRTWKTVKSDIAKEAYPFIAKTKLAKDIAPADITQILASMIQRGASTQSNRIRSYLHAAFNCGIKYDNDPANMDKALKFHLAFNPVAAVPRQASAEHVRDRELKMDEIWQLFAKMKAQGFLPVTQICIALLFHTGGQRPYELLSAKWKDIDYEKSLIWEIPPEISKNKRAHLIPLTNTAIALLKELYLLTGHSEYLFPKRGQPTEHTPTTSLAQSIRRYCDSNNFERFQPKDIRRTCKTRMGEIGISKETRDRVHNHALSDVSSKHYDRYDYLTEKREALEQWENRLLNAAQ